MKIIKSILTKNPCYSRGRKMDNGVQGLTLHSVGCAQPRASVFINNWNRADFDAACVHGFIDGLTGDSHQTLPWDWRGWHGGSGPNGSVNNTHIGIEMCEPDCITYTGGANFTCSNLVRAKEIATRTYNSAVELFAMLCAQYKLNPLKDGVIISHKEGHARGIASNHGDPEHLWKGLGLPYTMDTFRKAVANKMNNTTTNNSSTIKGLQAAEFANLTEEQVIGKVGPLFTADQKKTGILAAISFAQFILECGYGKIDLAQKANNCFGMKKSLSGNTWANSVWDGVSIYTKTTQEQKPDGTVYNVRADFRKYSCVEDSIADHSAYLLGAMNGSKKRYEGLYGCTDYKKAIQIIKDGGYATDISYVKKICNIIEKWDLTKYNADNTSSAPVVNPTEKFPSCPFTVKVLIDDLNYRSEGSMNGTVLGQTGKGIFTIVEVNDDNWGRLKSGAGWIYLGNTDYCVVHQSKCPYLVKVLIDDLRIRTGPGTEYTWTGKYTKKGTFTIVEEKDNWGKLKSGAGWICLAYCKEV